YMTQGKYREIMGGGLLSWRSIDAKASNFTLYMGVFVRYQDAFVPTLKIDYSNYSLTCSYDINTSPLKLASNNAGWFEMSIFVRGNYNKSYSDKQVRCPQFEQMLPMF